MPYKDPEKRKQYQRDYRRKRRAEDPEFVRKEGERRRAWAKKYPDKVRAFGRRSYHKLRRAVIFAYGGDPPRCACCGESHYEFLEIDHIKGGGNAHRAQFSSNTQFYQWLKKNNYPTEPSLRVLCSNCNMAYAHWSYCPHETEK